MWRHHDADYLKNEGANISILVLPVLSLKLLQEVKMISIYWDGPLWLPWKTGSVGREATHLPRSAPGRQQLLVGCLLLETCVLGEVSYSKASMLERPRRELMELAVELWVCQASKFTLSVDTLDDHKLLPFSQLRQSTAEAGGPSECCCGPTCKVNP